MKLNKIALAVFATVATAASAGVTVTPLVGYNYVDDSAAAKHQRKTFEVNVSGLTDEDGKSTKGVALDSGLYTGVALGVELTPSTQFQVEYGVTDVDAFSSEKDHKNATLPKFSGKQENLSGNFLVGTEQFSGYTTGNLKPYVLVGAGQQKTEVKNESRNSDALESTDTIGNLGFGARYLVNDALALRGEVRAEHNFDENWWNGKALAGLEVALGGRLAPAVPVAPIAQPVVEPVAPVVIKQPVVAVIEETDKDSDLDGVFDSVDACPGTPRNVVVDAHGCPLKVDVTTPLRLELRAYFDRDKSDIKPQFREDVAKVAQAMREFPNATATIEGHASKDSPRSSAKYNQRLSEARANAVKSMLTREFNIAPNRVSAIGYGFDRPIAPNDTAEGRAMNRRVYAVISGDRTQTVEQTKDMVVR
ncbi:OmpA family protein [Moraxella nasovis]|uniref:OmpA family protein n=1 Tax=Moraxella nasovis TaxID=2904121 RepID=UPI001F60E81A|nr:OmpA family protein [Moraxella nasovis]UNU74152.1 OmpA family protein [Moraxella nasovis]